MSRQKLSHKNQNQSFRRRRRYATVREDLGAEAHLFEPIREPSAVGMREQHAQLSNTRLPTLERQAMAEGIAQMQGNRTLTNTLAALRQDDKIGGPSTHPQREGALIRPQISFSSRQPAMVARQDTDPAKPDTAADLKAKDALIEQIYGKLQGKPEKEEDKGTEAITKVAEAALETEPGKKIQKEVKQYLFSTKGAPVTIMLGAAGVAAMIANHIDVPKVEIPLSEKMKLTVDLKGPITKPEGVMATFELKF